MAKKFNYKLPSMVALTLFGTAFTAHQANAAEQPQDQSNHKNVFCLLYTSDAADE